MSYRSRLRPIFAAAVGCLLTGALAAPASAAPPGDLPGRAVYRGAPIDLKKGWGAAQACVVLEVSDTRCYDSYAEADASLGYPAQADPAVRQGVRTTAQDVSVLTVPSCTSGWLCLYENTNGGGRRLQFNDEYWHYLSNWGFDRKTSSWRNNQGSTDAGHLSMHNTSTVYNCGARTYALSMGSYNDRAYAVWG